MFFGASPVFFGIPTNGQRFPRVTPTETWQQSSRCVSARFASALGSQGGAASDDAAGAGSYPATRAGNGDLQARKGSPLVGGGGGQGGQVVLLKGLLL